METTAPTPPSRTPAPDPVRELAWGLGVLACVLVAYAGVLRLGFLWDDHWLVEGRSASGWLAPFVTPYWRLADVGLGVGAYYRPVTELTWIVDRALHGPGPWGFHLTNWLLHGAASVLLYALCRRAGAPRPAAALGALLFGLLPRSIEAVAIVTGRTDLLATTAVLAALLLWSDRPARRWAAAGAIAVGLLAKEVAIAGVFALAALELAAVRRQRRTPVEALRRGVPVVVVVFAWLGLRAWALGGAVVESTAFALDQRLLFVPQAIGRYALMLGDPLRPALRIGRLGVVEPFVVALGIAVAIATAGLAVQAWRQRWRPSTAAAGALAVTGIAPVLHVFAPLQEVVASDRYLYLPVAALVWGATPALARTVAAPAYPRTRALGVGAVAAALAGAFGLATVAEISLWEDERALWRATARRAHPLDALPATTLGGLHARAADRPGAIRWYEAAARIHAAYERAVGVPSGNAQLVAAHALALSEAGRVDEALVAARRGLADYPTLPIVHRSLGLVHARRLEFGAADPCLARAASLAVDPAPIESLRDRIRRAAAAWRALPPERSDEPIAIRVERARLFAAVGRMDRATRLFEAIALDPVSDAEALRVATVYLVHQGPPAVADRALERLAAGTPSDSGEPRALRRRLEERRLELEPTGHEGDDAA